MNWDEVLNIRTGGHFLDSAHTLALCREQHQPEVFLRQGRDDYEKSNRNTAFEEARSKALSLIKNAPMEGYLDAKTNQDIAKIVAAGDKKILEAAAAPGAVAVI